MPKIYEYAKIVNRRADKNTRLYWRPYEDFADGLIWEWENKTQFNNEEKEIKLKKKMIFPVNKQTMNVMNYNIS